MAGNFKEFQGPHGEAIWIDLDHVVAIIDANDDEYLDVHLGHSMWVVKGNAEALIEIIDDLDR